MFFSFYLSSEKIFFFVRFAGKLFLTRKILLFPNKFFILFWKSVIRDETLHAHVKVVVFPQSQNRLHHGGSAVQKSMRKSWNSALPQTEPTSPAPTASPSPGPSSSPWTMQVLTEAKSATSTPMAQELQRATLPRQAQPMMCSSGCESRSVGLTDNFNPLCQFSMTVFI